MSEIRSDKQCSKATVHINLFSSILSCYQNMFEIKAVHELCSFKYVRIIYITCFLESWSLSLIFFVRLQLQTHTNRNHMFRKPKEEHHLINNCCWKQTMSWGLFTQHCVTSHETWIFSNTTAKTPYLAWFQLAAASLYISTYKKLSQYTINVFFFLFNFLGGGGKVSFIYRFENLQWLFSNLSQNTFWRELYIHTWTNLFSQYLCTEMLFPWRFYKPHISDWAVSWLTQIISWNSSNALVLASCKAELSTLKNIQHTHTCIIINYSDWLSVFCTVQSIILVMHIKIY